MAQPSLAEQLFGLQRAEHGVWQDRDIRFDASAAEVELRSGEQQLDVQEPVEDTKGNNGNPGVLRITNMRLMWADRKNWRTNLSIGLGCVMDVSAKVATSRLKGNTAALYIMARVDERRFEFIFTAVGSDTTGAPRLFASVHAVVQAYEGSRLYRELKLRGAVVADGELRLLPRERCYSRVNGVCNLSSEHGNLGTLFVTDVRLVWFSNMAETFNVSIPHMQIKAISMRESKFGTALVVETTARSGGYVLGFKVDPRETLETLHKEVTSLHKIYTQQPKFGVEVDVSRLAGGISDTAATGVGGTVQEVEDVQIVDAGHKEDAWAAYYAGGGSHGCAKVEYCPGLGLAIEALEDGLTIEGLWSVL